MKNKTNQQETKTQNPMFFNSDGFNFFISLLIGCFKFIGILLLVILNIIIALPSPGSNKDKRDRYVSLDPLQSESENKFNGTGYYK